MGGGEDETDAVGYSLSRALRNPCIKKPSITIFRSQLKKWCMQPTPQQEMAVTPSQKVRVSGALTPSKSTRQRGAPYGLRVIWTVITHLVITLQLHVITKPIPGLRVIMFL